MAGAAGGRGAFPDPADGVLTVCVPISQGAAGGGVHRESRHPEGPDLIVRTDYSGRSFRIFRPGRVLRRWGNRPKPRTTLPYFVRIFRDGPGRVHPERTEPPAPIRGTTRMITLG